MWNAKLGVKEGVSLTISMTKSYESLRESYMKIFPAHPLPHLRSQIHTWSNSNVNMIGGTYMTT